MITAPDFQSYAGPGDRNLSMTEVSGYQPVSRIGEIAMNAFVDAYEFSSLEEGISKSALLSLAEADADINSFESRPHFHEWATVQPGMVCVARKKKTAVFRNYIAAETAVPVIACCACLPKADENNYFFAGIARSKSVRTPDDGMGPTTDEFFTVSIGGMATLLNTSGGPIYPGDLLEWCFSTAATSHDRRAKQGPRRIAVQVASVSSPRLIGRALSFSKSGETFDVSAEPLTRDRTTACNARPLLTRSNAAHFADVDSPIGWPGGEEPHTRTRLRCTGITCKNSK